MNQSTAGALSARDTLIVNLWKSGESDAYIADQCGCDPQTVRKVRRVIGLTEADRVKRPKRRGMWERRPRSSLHSQIGYDVSAHRRLELNKDLNEYADMILVSRQRLVEIEAGVHNLTLDEIQRISRLIGRPIHELVTARNA